MKVQELVSHPYGDLLTAGTVAIQIGKELWVGSVRGNRIPIFPATHPRGRGDNDRPGARASGTHTRYSFARFLKTAVGFTCRPLRATSGQ